MPKAPGSPNRLREAGLQPNGHKFFVPNAYVYAMEHENVSPNNVMTICNDYANRMQQGTGISTKWTREDMFQHRNTVAEHPDSRIAFIAALNTEPDKEKILDRAEYYITAGLPRTDKQPIATAAIPARSGNFFPLPVVINPPTNQGATAQVAPQTVPGTNITPQTVAELMAKAIGTYTEDAFGEGEAVTSPARPAAPTIEPTIEAAKRKWVTDNNYFFGLPRLTLELEKRFIPKTNGQYLPTQQDEEIFQYIAGGEHPVVLWGEKGSGKTERGRYFAKEWGNGFVYILLNNQAEKEDVIGQMLPDGVGGVKWVDGPFAEAFRKGYLCFVDEYLVAKPGLFMMFQDVMLKDTDLAINTAYGYEVIPRHENFRMILATNPPDEYPGLYEQNAAQNSRPWKFDIEYPEKAIEVKILKTKFGQIDEKIITSLVDFARETRTNKQKNPEAWSYIVSLRELEMICESITNYSATPRRAVEIVVLNAVKFEAKHQIDSMRTMVNTRFGSR
jgi:nitric oxide reductase NorQ protein